MPKILNTLSIAAQAFSVNGALLAIPSVTNACVVHSRSAQSP